MSTKYWDPNCNNENIVLTGYFFQNQSKAYASLRPCQYGSSFLLNEAELIDSIDTFCKRYFSAEQMLDQATTSL